ncbi:MAG: TIGR00270 family protein [Promethearchaeota archaeon]|nr:MAG: TIGR00270 family protein [Candidatus Lokiarchaeota archaeon]
MHKKKTIGIDDDCPICGGKIWGKGQKVLIEGAKITVCQSCAHLGKKIIIKTEKRHSPKFKPAKQNLSRPKKTFKTTDILEPTVEIVDDYSIRIRKVRTQNNLTQEQFAQKLNEKPSLIRRIEAGKVEPNLKLAKKIEKVYNISLLKDIDRIEVSTKKFMKKSSGSSMGDIAFIKRKK